MITLHNINGVPIMTVRLLDGTLNKADTPGQTEFTHGEVNSSGCNSYSSTAIVPTELPLLVQASCEKYKYRCEPTSGDDKDDEVIIDDSAMYRATVEIIDEVMGWVDACCGNEATIPLGPRWKDRALAWAAENTLLKLPQDPILASNRVAMHRKIREMMTQGYDVTNGADLQLAVKFWISTSPYQLLPKGDIDEETRLKTLDDVVKKRKDRPDAIVMITLKRNSSKEDTVSVDEPCTDRGDALQESSSSAAALGGGEECG